MYHLNRCSYENRAEHWDHGWGRGENEESSSLLCTAKCFRTRDSDSSLWSQHPRGWGRRAAMRVRSVCDITWEPVLEITKAVSGLDSRDVTQHWPYARHHWNVCVKLASMVVHACVLRTQEAKAGGSWAQVQLGLHNLGVNLGYMAWPCTSSSKERKQVKVMSMYACICIYNLKYIYACVYI